MAMSVQIRQTEIFLDWLNELRDERARVVITNRIARMSLGNLGTCAPIGHGVSEAKIDYGPGYRLYFIQRGQFLVILLCGGSKATQQKDIRKAHQLAQELKS